MPAPLPTRQYLISHAVDIVINISDLHEYCASELRFSLTLNRPNLSEIENRRNRERTQQQGLAGLIDIRDGSFESLPFDDNTFDVVWSQDALLHSGDRALVLHEVERVLKPSGQFIFTDPMATNDCDTSALRPVLDRLHLDTMGSPRFYENQLRQLGMFSIDYEDHTTDLGTHYRRVLEETQRRHPQLAQTISEDYLTRMKTGLQRSPVRTHHLGHLPRPTTHSQPHPLTRPPALQSARHNVPSGIALRRSGPPRTRPPHPRTTGSHARRRS